MGKPKTTTRPEKTDDSPVRLDPMADLETLRLSQDFAGTVGVRKLLTTVPVRKPHRQEFVRVHPDESYRLPTPVLELKEDNESYLVDRTLWQELPGEIVPKTLFVAINRQGVVFIWPVRMPGEDGRIDSWNQSAAHAAELATSRWIRLASNRSLGAYEISEATGDLPEPTWPEHDLPALLRIAFKGRYIDSLDHPVVARLRGMS